MKSLQASVVIICNMLIGDEQSLAVNIYNGGPLREASGTMNTMGDTKFLQLKN